jgi:hypothetical protein
MKLLELICHVSFVGETPALIAGPIISLLSKSTRNSEDFIKKMLKTKILIYRTKEKRMADIFRDNRFDSLF